MEIINTVLKILNKILEIRLLVWFLLWLLGGFVVYYLVMQQSWADYNAGHRSAFAWHGFLPFVIPFFLLESAKYVVPAALVVELGIFIKKFWSKK